ncbi:SDR family oxidoreductase [Cecembia calidifontis]|jgi:NAD(P)-dependent dehydrogenase (short-subunit alcohol dehydrogenase family)|uniref:NAD(P)-dependent dehydrogenase (Short-subunit alcohol dehydrogenase family) n=1 Tax=Cecembia calidifontis TaxID=1187080 RepID=A0A4Q7PB11_9BACT|nr:SDR family oxidoreductase [Cecembia calidifontis]RZS97375.1 NAD(P)-dependent dehydrogenase (short-subunit alcohol dehydrogenase family) [Cecembia calidifontis]
MKLFSVKNKKIIITGATGVLGTAMAHHLAKEGAHIIIIGRTASKIEHLVEDIRSKGGKADAFLADVTSETHVIQAAAQIQKRYKKIDILINLAGGNMPDAVVRPDQTLADLSADAMKKVMDLNYQGTFIPIKHFFPLMLANGSGNIINISSMAASRPMTRVAGYASAKAAIDNLTKWLAVELNHKHGPEYRVNAIAPGFFLTEQNRNLLTEKDGQLTQRGHQIIQHTPMGRFGDPEDLLGTLQWLCSDASKFITGTIVAVDGGFSAYSGV